MIEEILFIASFVFSMYVAVLGIPPVSGRVVRKLFPDPRHRMRAFVSLMYGGLFCGLGSILFMPLYNGMRIAWWVWVATEVDSWLSHDDRGKRWREKIASRIKFKKFDSRPLARPAPSPV